LTTTEHREKANSISSRSLIGVNSMAAEGPKLDAPLGNVHSPEAPISSSAEDSFFLILRLRRSDVHQQRRCRQPCDYRSTVEDVEPPHVGASVSRKKAAREKPAGRFMIRNRARVVQRHREADW
jgi:hypothetical protein